MRLHHLAVIVSDLQRAEQFYSGILGASVVARHTFANGEPRSVWLSLEVGFLALEVATPGSSTSERDSTATLLQSRDADVGWHCVAFKIERSERTSMRQRLLDQGVLIERESDYTLYVRDFDNNLLGFSHYPEPA